MAEEQNRTLQDKFMLRLPAGMRERIKAAAERHGRSMNSEILSVLEEVYPEPFSISEQELEAALRAARKAVYALEIKESHKDLIWEQMMTSFISEDAPDVE